MPSRQRQGNNPKRRVETAMLLSAAVQERLAAARYTGSPLHKSRPADYGFNPPTAARPDKSLCDYQRVINWREAIRLFRSGIKLGMVSSYREGGLPKYVWAVDSYGEAYEAKLGEDGASYHGYPLYREQRMRQYILEEWKRKVDGGKRVAD